MKRIFLLIAALVFIPVVFGQTWDKVYPEKDGLRRVLKYTDFNGAQIPLYGFISSKGEIIVPCIYDYVDDYNNGYALVYKFGRPKPNWKGGALVLQPKFTYIDRQGNELKYAFFFASSIKPNGKILIGVPFYPYTHEPIHRLDEVKCQYIEFDFDTLIKHNGNQVHLNLPQPYLPWSKAKNNGAEYRIRYNLEIPIHDIDGYVHRYASSDFYKFKSQCFPKKFIDHIRIESKIDTVNNKYIYVCQHGLTGIRDFKSQKLIIPCMFTDVVVLGGNYFGVRRDSKWAIIDKTGKYLTDYIFDDISGRIEDNEFFAIVYKIKETLYYGSREKYIYSSYSVSINNLDEIIKSYFTK